MENRINNPRKENMAVKVIPLGGVEEIGINCTILEYNSQILVIDAGLGFSDYDYLGVDYLIPNYDYLQKNKSRILAIVITHGHLDHIGAIEHFVKELGYPEVYAPRFAMELIYKRLEEAGELEKAKSKLNIFDAAARITKGPFVIEPFHVNHSIPDSYGLLIDTPAGRIAHTGDFKFDHSPLNEPLADYYKMSKAGNDGIKLLLSDSTNSTREGHSISEKEIMKQLASVVASAEGRVIVATFASLITRLYALVEIAKKYKRKIYITGRSMENSITIARRLGYIDATDDLFIKGEQLNRHSDKNIMVLATGSQGESMSALARISRGEHRFIKIKKGDTVLLSSSVIPGNDALVQSLISDVSSKGAIVIHQEIMNVHTSGHGFKVDQKLMLNLFKPEYFMPVHGMPYLLSKHGETAVMCGVKEENVILTTRGEVIELTNTSWKRAGKIKNMPLLVSAGGVGELGPIMLETREQLAANGVVTLTILLQKTKDNRFKLYKDPFVYSVGFVFVKDNKELIDQIGEKVKQVVSFNQQNKEGYIQNLRAEVEKHVGGMIKAVSNREPLIVTVVEIIE
jgi:ribonuclease J